MNLQGYEKQFRTFLAQNAAFWRENTGVPLDDDSRLYVDLAHDNPAYLLTNLWIAKYIQKIRGGRLVGLAQAWPKPCGFYDFALVRQLAESFLVEEIIDLDAEPDESHEVLTRFRNAVIGLRGDAFRKAILRFDHEVDPDIGWILYDTWLREEFIGTVEAFTPELETCARSVFRTRQRVKAVMGKERCAGAIVGHYHYSPYAFIALEATRRQAPVYFQWVLVPVSIRQFNSPSDVRRGRAAAFLSAYREHFADHVDLERLERWKQRVFDVQSGTREFLRVIEGYEPKRTRHEFLNRLGLDPDQPVVCLYAPAMCAAPHCFGEMAYADFSDWLEQSLQIASETPASSFLIRRHPQDAVYDRLGVVDLLEKKYGHIRNIRFLSNEIPAEQMAEVCDLVVVVSGTPGYDMAIRGVPTLAAGPNRYSGLGFATEALDRTSYRLALSSVRRRSTSEAERQAALLFAYFELAAGRAQSLFVPRFRSVGTAEFWAEAELNLRSRYVEEDPLYRNLRHMLAAGLPFLLNNDLVESAPLQKSQARPDEKAPAAIERYTTLLSALHQTQNRASVAERQCESVAEDAKKALELVAGLIHSGGAVRFGVDEPGNYLLAAGWSKPEQKGIWTDGCSAEIVIPWKSGASTLCLECCSYSPDFSPVRSVDLFCNGIQLDHKVIPGPLASHIWMTTIDALGPSIRILLRIPQPAMPPGDPRMLGLWLSRLWVAREGAQSP